MENPKKVRRVHNGYPAVHNGYHVVHNGYPAVHNGYPAVHNGYLGLTGVGARDTCLTKNEYTRNN